MSDGVIENIVVPHFYNIIEETLYYGGDCIMKEETRDMLLYIASGFYSSMQQTARCLAYFFIVFYVPYVLAHWVMVIYAQVDPLQFMHVYAYTVTLAFPLMMIVTHYIPMELNFETMQFEVVD